MALFQKDGGDFLSQGTNKNLRYIRPNPREDWPWLRYYAANCLRLVRYSSVASREPIQTKSFLADGAY